MYGVSAYMMHCLHCSYMQLCGSSVVSGCVTTSWLHFAVHCTGCPLFSTSTTKSLWSHSSASTECPAHFVLSVGVHTMFHAADHGDLIEHRTNIKRYGPQNFYISAPGVWNKLLSHLRTEDNSREQFAQGLKIYLFVHAYSLEVPL